MSSGKKHLQSTLWLSRLENISTDLRALFQEIDALGYLRQLGPRPQWHTELVRAGVAVHEAIEQIEGVFEADGWTSSEHPAQLRKSCSPLN